MSADNADTTRAYHHGDLRRGLTEAAQRLLDTQGVDALSLRAVAREAGVSPAAPYHHFKDKNELLDAVARRGWIMLSEQVEAARGADGLTGLGMAYVSFARNNLALYHLRVKQTFADKRRSALDAMAYSASLGLTAALDQVLGISSVTVDTTQHHVDEEWSCPGDWFRPGKTSNGERIVWLDPVAVSCSLARVGGGL